MTTATAKRSKIADWRDGSAGFFLWLDDVKPLVPSAKGGFEPYVPGQREREEIAKALDGGFSTVVFCWPRRHGKTLVSALIIVWRFLTRQTQNVAVVANSERQTTDTAFRTIRTVIEQTPYTKALVKAGSISITADKIEYAALGNVIQGFASSPAALYGKKITIAQISELHAARTDDAYQVLASSTIDTDDGLVLVDSTTGSRSSPLFALYGSAQRGDDPTLFFSHISYRDLEDACANAPRWISPAKLRSRASQMLPAEFAQQHLNLWTASSSALFPADVIERCRDSYRIDLPSITGGAAHIVGAGLDRAFGFSIHGDATVTTAVVKLLVGEDDHFYVLASDKVRFSGASGIKSNFSRYARDYGLKRAAIESYNAQDISAWCGDQAFDHEVIHPTAERQANAFTTLHTIAAEGRLHIHPSFESLLAELGTFEYQHDGGGLPKFEAIKGAHDDFVYSLAWAVYSLRDVELNPYELKGIDCNGPGPAPTLCLLNGGGEIPPCADGCRSMRAARDLYRAYRARGSLIPLAFDDFAITKLKNVGAHVTPR
ncbi:terminase large subunit [Azospirillum sp. SYSU D00513]|uniref:terminase large subunit domain-containing protein n=1 Tax=Azospirillum sp. SYSU D00513 TaxID=2812561 RepID=UPI001A9629A0|nr:terminase large subunit [Azospirillum sp. SYSU D00513]